MAETLITIGDKISIVKSEKNRKPSEKPKRYVSQLLEYDGMDTAKIAMPIDAGMVYPLKLGGEYTLTFYTKKGLYECGCVIIKRSKEQNIHTLEVAFTTNFRKDQRREYYRLDCLFDILYRVETDEEVVLRGKLQDSNNMAEEECIQISEHIKELEESWIHAVVTDISGGGLRYNSEKQCEKGNKAFIKLSLQVGGIIKTIIVGANVIASIPLRNNSTFYEHRIEFVDIDRNEREYIIRFIFEEERRIRRKEKGLG